MARHSSPFQAVGRAVSARLVLAALPGMLACGELASRGSPGPAELDHAAFEPVSLAGEVVYDGEDLALPARIADVGEHLVVIDPAADSMIHVIGKSDGAPVRSFGRRGSGPGEYQGAWSIDPVPGRPDEFWIYDLGLLRLTHIDLDRDFSAGARHEPRTLNMTSDATVIDPIWADTLLVSIGMFASGRLALFDRHGRFLRTVGELPPGGDDVPASVLQHAYQSTLKSNTSRSLFAAATRHADRIEIYAVDGSPVAAPEPLFGFTPAFEVGDRGGRAAMVTGDDLRFGYVDLAADDEAIYALFSGRTRRGFPGRANFGEYVHVFDWNGELKGVIELGVSAIAITVDGPAGFLYAVRHEPHPAVLRYPIRQAIRTQ